MLGSDVVHTSVSVSVLSREMLKGSCCIYVHVELCYFTQNFMPHWVSKCSPVGNPQGPQSRFKN